MNKKSINSILLNLILIIVPSINAQTVTPPGTLGGGGSGATTDAGSSFPTCSPSSLIYTDASKLMQCNPATIVSGSVTTAGRSILSIKDIITGNSATSNFFNITSTFPATLSAETNALYVATTFDNDAIDQFGIQSNATGGASPGATQGAIKGIINAGYTGNSSTWGGYFVNNTASGGGNRYGIEGNSNNAVGGTQFGVGGLANSNNSAGINIGVSGTSFSGSTTSSNMGVYGIGDSRASSGHFAGGYFTLRNTGAVLGITPTGKAALIANNAAEVYDIFQGQTGGSAVFTLSPTGYVQGTRGEVALNANYTNATAAFSSTNLSVDVVSGRTYSFDLNLLFSDSTAADGAQFDFNGGGATVTNFNVHCTAANNVGAVLAITNAASTTLATAVQVALALTTQAALTCHGSFVPSSSSTFIIRAAQTAHTTGTLTINRGSWFSVRDARPL